MSVSQHVDGRRVVADLRELATFGQVETGVRRPSLSEPDMQAREWLADKFQEAGLWSSIDGCGNVLGACRTAGPVLLLGSHSDSQPRGGWLDGALGVIYALEVARVVAAGFMPGLAVDIISFVDEEGTFFPSLGSRLFGNQMTIQEAASFTSREDEAGWDEARPGRAGGPPATPTAT